jgi:nickel-dependent lactate racemase
MLYVDIIKERGCIAHSEVKDLLFHVLSRLGKQQNVIAVPPDITRYPSRAGLITGFLYEYYHEHLDAVLPATGLHAPMSRDERREMFGSVPEELFFFHDPENGVTTLGDIPGEEMDTLTQGVWSDPWPCQVNRLLCRDDPGLIISIGQVVPHEVAGMANYDKNIFVGTGGRKGIDSTHYISALYGIERTLGEIDTPVRRIFHYASGRFFKTRKILYILTVIGPGADGNPGLKGLFIGDDEECFFKAAHYSQSINITRVPEPVAKMVVYLDPLEYKSTWLGNKAIYRTRCAMKEGGELIIIAPGISVFGEIPGIDVLIRKYGYAGTEKIKELVRESPDLGFNLAVAAHLIHGSPDGGFSVTLCPGKMGKDEVERVHFYYEDPDVMMKLYDPGRLKPGKNVLKGGEEIYFVQQPGLGLWTSRES